MPVSSGLGFAWISWQDSGADLIHMNVVGLQLFLQLW